MSTIDIKKVLQDSEGYKDLAVTYTFKLSVAHKDEFLALCDEKSLSPGKVMRSLLVQFLDGAK